MQQLGRHREIDLGAVEMGMAEPGGERRQQPLHVGTLAVPRFQSVNGCGVTQRMKARRLPSVVLVVMDPGRLEQPLEGEPNGALDQRHAIAVCEEGRGRALRQWTLRSSAGIGAQSIGKLGTDGNEAGFVELGIAYGQHRIAQVDIIERQALRFTEPKTCAIEQQEQSAQGLRIELDRALPADVDGAEQSLQLVSGEDVRGCRARLSRFVIGRGKRRPDDVAAADRVAIEPGQCSVLVGPVPGERTVAGKEAQNIRKRAKWAVVAERRSV